MTRQILVGGVPIGGGAPISIQSMCNTRTEDVARTVAQIKRLEAAGCDIVRVAVPDMAAAEAISQIKRQIAIPLVADIHFDWRLAVCAAQRGADKIRINPGNIGGADRVLQVAQACKERHIPIRIGVNGGSLEKTLLERYGGVTADALVESALGEMAQLEKCGFEDILISIKATSVPVTVEACRKLRQKTDCPLHIGVTESGTLSSGLVKSAVGIGTLLLEGIGDTLRVSLTADPVEEVVAARRILQAAGLRQSGVELISCPTCGRTKIDLISLANEVEARLAHVKKEITVAVMGCVVNGPGEARAADVGIAGGDGVGVVFRKGEPVKTVPQDALVDALMEEIQSL